MRAAESPPPDERELVWRQPGAAIPRRNPRNCGAGLPPHQLSGARSASRLVSDAIFLFGPGRGAGGGVFFEKPMNEWEGVNGSPRRAPRRARALWIVVRPDPVPFFLNADAPALFLKVLFEPRTSDIRIGYKGG